mmetsp:Transcript_9394/g.22180  ORF Transcript_9394/g.22180 Transcript_9394/m.22180 type:complete len:93 (+) Transcript_9394:901-1179(+)
MIHNTSFNSMVTNAQKEKKTCLHFVLVSFSVLTNRCPPIFQSIRVLVTGNTLLMLRSIPSFIRPPSYNLARYPCTSSRSNFCICVSTASAQS